MMSQGGDSAGEASGAVLAMRGVCYAWSKSSPALHFPDIVLSPGEKLLLQGPSGCGKSTLLGLAAGVLLPAAGDVALMGRRWQQMSAWSRDAWRVDHVGYIFQQFNLLPYLSVLSNVMLPCDVSAKRAARSASDGGSRQAAAHLLQQLDLPESLWHRPASALSVGQQQRVAAARALMGRPPLVIADEPTSALDEARRDEFMALLTSSCQANQSALLFVSHDVRLAHHFDRVMGLPDGLDPRFRGDDGYLRSDDASRCHSRESGNPGVIDVQGAG